VRHQVEVLRQELALHDPALVSRASMLVGTKADALSDPGRRGDAGLLWLQKLGGCPGL